MKKSIRKTMSMLVLGVMLLAISGCGFSIGTESKSEDYKELFPDRFDEDAKAYKHSQVAYSYKLDGYGEMLVYVDTTDGYKFELNEEYGGFDILDEDGELALRAVMFNLDQYKALTADVEKTKTYNNRDFFYDKNEQGVLHAFSYMADVGLDCGMGLETEDADNFTLVAFRGEALDGSSTDLMEYKGDSSAVEAIVDEEPVEEVDTEVDVQAMVSTTLDPEVEELLNSLDTDYGRVAWGVRYPISEDLPYFVISVTPYTVNNDNYLIIGLTNLYDTPIDFSASPIALDASGAEIGDTFIYQSSIGTGNTVISMIHCDGAPDGRVRWTECDLEEAKYNKYIPWEADYNITATSGSVDIAYDFYSANKEDMEGADVTALILDQNGFVIGMASDFMTEDIAAGEKYSGSMSTFLGEDMIKKAAGIALFSNPTVSTY